MVERRA